MKVKNILSKILLSIMLVVISITTLTGCKKKLTDTPLENMQQIANFTEGKQKEFFASDGWSNGDPFNVTWTGKNISYEEDGARLYITEEDGKYYGAELRSSAHYHYGDYEITMKPNPKKGTCSSFFIYTGPSEVNPETGERNPHDEIDIEFLGKDTTHVQFNFFVNGKGGNEYKYDLGFDASKEFHTYGFRWTESYITWYVDGKPVYRVDETAKKPLPQTPGRIMMNYWCGTKNAELWMSKYSHDNPGLGSFYQLVKTSATPIGGAQVVNGIKWDEITPLADLLALGDDKHVITTNGSEYNVKYTNNQGASYTNVKWELDGAAENTNLAYLKVKNNGTDDASIRVDIFGDATRKTANNKNVCNVSATIDGVEAPTDLNWGGSTFNNIHAGDTVEIIIYFEGYADSMQIMFNTHIYQDTKTHSGDLTIFDLKFAKLGELKLPEREEPTPGTPVLKVNGVDKEIAGNLETYKLSMDGDKLVAAYENVGVNYHNINAQVGDVAASMDQVSFKITNNGPKSTRVRVDVDSNTKVLDTTACNISATMNGMAVYTDTQWGGSVFEIAPGSTVTCVISFDNSRGPKQLMFFIDSAKYGDTETHSGSISIFDVIFANDNNNEPNQPGGSVESDKDAVAVEFTTDGAYTVVNNSTSKSSDVTYKGIMDSSYKCICANLTSVISDNNKITLSIKNNGTETVTLRIDVGYTENYALVSKIISVDGGTFNDYDDTAQVSVAAGVVVTLTITFDTTTPVDGMNIFVDSGVWMDEALRESHSGNISVFNIKLSK